jgi:small-conductance mechanosensitive channel
VAFQPKFATLSSFQKADYVGTLVMAATTLILLTAPSSWHRILFRRGDKTHLVRVANRFTMTGQATMGLTVIGVVMLLSDIAFRPVVTVLVTAITVMASATAWYIMPLARRRQLEWPRVTETRSPREPRSKRQPGAA